MPGKEIDLDAEIGYQFSRSGGKGGQHVNKVETSVELRFDVGASRQLTARQKARIHKRLANRINQEGVLVLKASDSRSQKANKEAVRKRFYALIRQALKEPKKRIKTKPGKAAIERRLQAKKRRSAKKFQRRKGGWENE
ncbi:MAG: aminoacyl-tRNA hydrolase [Bacteroidetes bacterium]|nr:MAG: aminoacyl-tRNA hydrolase [Bacteroidota bacterium]